MLSSLLPTDLSAIEAAIADLDPDGKYVKLNVTDCVVEYSNLIKSHERITNYVGTEEPVRAFWVAWLCTTGVYPPSAIELERPYAYGRGGNAQLDIRISESENNTNAFALIEVKAPDQWKGKNDKQIRSQLFAITGEDVAAKVLSLATLQVASDGTVTPHAITIARDTAMNYESWRTKKSPHVTTFPINYDQPTAEPYRYGGPRDLNRGLTRTQLDRLRAELHSKLWGGSRDDNQIYAWLVRLFLAKIFDEKHTGKGNPYSFQVLYNGTHKEGPVVTFNRINKTYQAAYTRYIDPKSKSDEGLSGSLFSEDELQWVVETLQQISLTSVAATTGDLLGGFFEAITREGFKQSKGLFFTHYNVAVFMLESLDLGELAITKLESNGHTNDRLPYVIDPSCGSGTFLLAAMRHITGTIQKLRSVDVTADFRDQLDSKFPESRPNEWAKDYLYGIEKREDLTISTKVNMVLHRDGNTHMFHDDGLRALDALSDHHSVSKFRPTSKKAKYYSKPRAETFDVVVTNPPFSITLDGEVRSELSQNFDLASDKNSENLFLERWYQLLKPGGRLGAVLPESFFSTTENMLARLFLLRHFNVRAVVSLPSHTFAPWTPTRTSLLFAQKKTAVEENEWAAAFDQRLAALTTSRNNVMAAVKKLKTPGRATSEQLEAERVRLSRDLSILGLGEAFVIGEELARESLDQIRATVKSLSIEAEAMKTAIASVGTTDYLALIVDEVGYRRTKRAENTAPNDLFAAFAPINTEMETSKRLLNLNDAPDGWSIKTAQDGTDALSIVKAAKLWQ